MRIVRRLRLRGRLVLVLATLTLVPVTALEAAPARAVTSYKWTGDVSSVWGTTDNWDPKGVPQNGDLVTLGPVGPNGVATITGVPDITLASLTVAGDPEQAVSMSGEGHVIVGNLQWTGGDISVDLTVSAPPLDPNPSFISPGQTPLRFGYGGHQTLTLLSNVEMPLGLGAGTAPWLTFMFDSSLRIASTATLRLDPAAQLAANRCCSGRTSTVIVDGTLEVFSITGATGFTATLDQLGLDFAGVVDVPTGNTVRVVGGPVRVGGTPLNNTVGDASLRGGGALEIVETDGDAFDAAHPALPDSTMKFLDAGETLTVSGRSTLALGDYTTVAGVGQIAGNGSVRLAGPEIRGELTLADSISATTVAGTDSRVVYWDAVRGQHGILTPRGGLDVVPGSTLTVSRGTRVVVPDGAELDLPGGSVLASGNCCSDPGRVTVQRGGTLAIGEGSEEGGADPTVLRWVELGGAGTVTHAGRSTWDLAGTAFTDGARLSGEGTIDGDLPAGALSVAPLGLLEVTGDYTPNAGGELDIVVADVGPSPGPGRLVVGGVARLAGALTLTASGRLRVPAVPALQAGAIDGRFRCATTPGYLPRYAGTTVTLRRIGVRIDGCLVPTSGRVLKASFKGLRTATLGVPAEARRVLLDVRLGRAAGKHSVVVSGGRGGSSTTVRAGAGKARRQYVAVSIPHARRLTARTDRRAQVDIGLVGWS